MFFILAFVLVELWPVRLSLYLWDFIVTVKASVH